MCISGNFVGETLTTIRANQGDGRVDWNASGKDKFFGRFSMAEYESRNDKRAMPLLLGNVTTAPFRNLAVNWNRIFSSSVVNEVLVGYNQITIVSDTLDWAGIGNGNATFGIAGGQPIPGLSSIGWASGLTAVGAGASDTDTVDKTFQINEKLTWLKGAHALKFGGQMLHYDQQRFYAGNNGLLGIFGYTAAFSGFAFSDFLLDQVGTKGRGSLAEPWTHLHNRVALFVQDDFKATPSLTLNLGMRWAYTQPVVEKDNRQSNFDLRTGQQILAAGWLPREPRAVQGLQEGLRAAPRLRVAARRGVGRARRLRHLAIHGGHRRQPAAAAEPAGFLRVGRSLRCDVGSRNTGHRFCGAEAAGPAFRAGARVGSEPPSAVHAAVERVRRSLLTSSMSANVGYVGHKATHLVTPVEGNQPLPGVGDPLTWAATQTRRPLFATAPLITNISTTAARGRSDYNGLQASVRQRNVEGCRVPGVVHVERDAPTTSATTARPVSRPRARTG